MVKNFSPAYFTRALITFLIFLFLFVASLQTEAIAGEYSVYGPRTFLRHSGKPVVESDTIEVSVAGSYQLKIQVGGLIDNNCDLYDGDESDDECDDEDDDDEIDDEHESVASGVIKLNGVKILSPNELNQNVSYIEKTVTLQQTNVLSVKVKGKPGGALIISINGIDNTPPVITANITPLANAAGWHNTDATVTFDCSDNLSGIASCPPPVTVVTEGAGQIVTGTAIDNAGNSADASVTINLDKSQPVINITSPTEGALLLENNVTVTGQIYDTNSTVSATMNGDVITLNTDGSFSHLVTLQDGLNILTIVATDNAGNTIENYLSVTLQMNQPPVATSLTPSVLEDTPLNVVLSANDPDGDALTYQLLTQPTQGVISGVAPNLVYTPNANYFGPDSFTYTVNDGQFNSNIATVTINVQSVNDLPAALDQSIVLDEDTSTNIVLTATDIESTALSYSIVQNPVNGTLTGTAPNYVYTPNGDFNGSDNLTFIANDGGADSNTATITISVQAINDAPVSQDQTVTLDEDASANIALVSTDVDNTLLTYVITQNPANGVLSGTAPDFVYTPNTDFNGADSFTYTANDGLIDSNAATISINVLAVNDAPVSQSQTIALDEDTSASITLTAIDTDSTILTYVVVKNPSSGILSGTIPNLVYTPQANFNGPDSFTYKANDGLLDSTIETISINVQAINDAPVPQQQSITLAEDTSTNITLAATDIDNPSLSYTLVQNPLNGILSGVAPNLTYTPAADYFGDDSLTFSVSDGLLSATAQVSLTVTPVNDAPVSSDIVLTTAFNTAANIILVGSDPELDPLTYSITTQPVNGTLSGAGENYTYTPNAGYTGTDTFLYSVNDGFFSSNISTVTITVDAPINPVINSAPVLFGFVGTNYIYDVDAVDPNNLSLQYALINPPAGMTIDTATGVINWLPQTVGAYDITLSISNGVSSPIAQSYQIQIVDAEPNHEGSDFWFMYMTNAGASTTDATVYISSQYNANGLLEVPGLGISIPFSVVPGQTLELTLPSTVRPFRSFFTTPSTGYGTIEEKGVHISSDRNIAVYALNKRPFSTDGFVVFPAKSLGKSYMALSSDNNAFMVGRSQIGLVASADNTAVSVKATISITVDGNGEQLLLMPGDTFDFVLNQGEIINMRSGSSSDTQANIADFTGAEILSDKPIAVFSGHECTNIPVAATACDHLVEQMPPVKNWGLTYVSMPLAERIGGDTYRVVASEDNTLLKINRGEQYVTLNKGKFFENRIEGPVLFEANHPVLVAQFSNSASIDNAQVGANYDPAMMLLPAKEQFVTHYTVTAPATGYVLNYANIIAPFAALASLTVDGQAIPAANFVQIQNTEFYGYQMPVISGVSHTFSADVTFGLALYGFSDFDSYAYMGGMLLPSVTATTALNLGAQQTVSNVGVQACYQATIIDNNAPIRGVRIDYTVTGANATTAHIITDQAGISEFCYIPLNAGADTITAQTAALNTSVTVSVDLTQNGNGNTAPYFISTPVENAGSAEPYTYQAQAFDLDANDVLSYNLLTFPQGMSITAAGLISWTPAIDQIGDHAIAVEVMDTTGLTAIQSYNLKVIQRNQPPVIVSVDLPTNAFIGHNYRGSITVSDPDGDVLTWDAQVIPKFMNINALANTTGLISWTPSVEAPGPVDASIVISDKKGGVLVYNWTINLALNATPEFVQTPIDQAIRANNLYQVQVIASDADNEPLTYSLRNNPPGMSIDPQTGLLTWLPTAVELGEYAVIVEVSDNLETASHPFTLTVFSEFTTYELSVDVTPQFADPGANISIQLDTIGEQFAVNYDLVVDGQIVIVDATGLANVTAPAQPGIYNIQATSSDGVQSATVDSYFTVKDPTDAVLPVINISLPTDGLIITEATSVTVTVNDINLAAYKLTMWPANRPQDAQLLAQGTQNISNLPIATIDTSVLINGLYILALEASDVNGNTALINTSFSVDGNLKVGNFSFTVEDLNIPLAGIPVQVSRTYDSRRRNEQRDLGYGWTIDYQNVELDTTRTLGAGWAVNQYNSGTLGEIAEFCVEPLGALNATVTLPDGSMETFDVRAVNACNLFVVDLDVELEFIATGNTLSTLRLKNLTTVRLVNGNLEQLGTSQVYNPVQYVLTTKQGYEYQLDQNFGISQVIDPNGNTLTYSQSGIIHSSGRSISFTRDSQGRITYVRAPEGKTIQYTYNFFGDLVGATGGSGGSGQTQYTYNNNHGMLDIIGPLGRKQLRNIYDDAGRLIAQEDGNGNRTNFTHDLVGRTSQVSDRLGRITQFAYNARGNVLSTVDAQNNLTQYTFDADDNQLSQTDALGNVTLATYDTRRNQLTQTDALGNTIAFTYNQRGQELTIGDAMNNQYINTYDAVGNLLTVQDPQGNIAGNNINAQGLPTLVRNTAGFDTTFTYDSFGNKITETDHLGNVTTFTYDANGNVLTESKQRTENGVLVTDVTTFAYDTYKQLQFVTSANGIRTQYVYDVAGNKTREIDPAGQTYFDYDAYHRLVSTTYPDQSTATKTYDAEGNLISETDRNSNVTTYTYDALNRLIQTTYTDASSTQTEYDAIGRVTAEIDENGNRTEHEYDAAGRRILTRDALGFETTFSYDANGNLISQTDANGNTTQYAYDTLDNRIKTIYPDLTENLQSYDAVGQLTSKTDQNGLVTQYSYDALGRLTKVTDALLNETSYTYDETGNKLTQTDAMGRTTSWAYDSEGNQLSRTLPLGQSETWVYSTFTNNLQSHTDFNGDTTTYTYDVNNRLKQISYVDRSTEVFKYDAEGNRIEATNRAARKETWTYDNRNRLTNNTKAFGDQIDYSYDGVGNRIQLTVTPSGGASEVIDYSFDALNRLSTVIDAQSQVTSYSYDDVGNRASVLYPNGNATSYVYDELNRLTRLTTADSLLNTLTDYQYTLDNSGQRTQIVEVSGRTSNYIYDDLYRLTTEDITDALNGNYSANYQYDTVGNRTASTVNGVQTLYTVDDNDRLIQQGGETFTYDENGNTLTKAIDADITTYSYNPKDELEIADITVLGANTLTSYQYDIDGIRSQKVANGETIDFVIDANRPYAQVVKETNATTGDVTDYLYGDDLIKQSKAANDSYYLYDGLGSTRALTNSAGTITDTYNYESFGSLLNQTGTTPNDYLFTGEQFDNGLDNYYLRARYYDQVVGRFTQQDTWMGENQDPITLHKYLYANTDPVNNIDPTGNFSMASVMTAVNIAGTLSTIASTAVDVFSIASGESEFNAVDFGTNVLLSRLPVKYVKSLYKKLCFKKNSFVAGTLVHTDSGLISIENIEIGQRVLTFNADEGITEYKEVVHLIEGHNEYELVIAELFNGDAIKATSNHPFYVNNEWIEAKDLTVEMMLSSYDGEVAINSIFTDKEHLHVYNLTVKDNHNYYVGKNGALVQNSTPKGCNIFNKAGEIDRAIAISSKKLQSKWKHAKAFGVSGNFSMKNAEGFRKAIDRHVKNTGSTPIAGTYRGQDVIHYFNSSTGLNVIKDLNGNFISGWKLSAAQLKNVTSRGSL